ncbi:FMN-binding protein [Rubritalea sp.]|uniref:FMN-binding protein n=1 Tax=Rubritalea sp. TaxID=2109375 RepID=UPI003EF198F9
MLGSVSEAADKVYEKPSVFMQRHFGNLPQTQTLTLSATQKSSLKSIFGHSFREKTVRYWQGGGKTIFILNEVGKSEPITIGVAVKGSEIIEMKVLVYRESHGWEVSKAGFTKQFVGATFDGKRLSNPIDGIVGATLSVNAMKKVGAAALYLSTQVK